MSWLPLSQEQLSKESSRPFQGKTVGALNYSMVFLLQLSNVKEYPEIKFLIRKQLTNKFV